MDVITVVEIVTTFTWKSVFGTVRSCERGRSGVVEARTSKDLDGADGMHSLLRRARIAGEYECTVTLRGEQVNGSPFGVCVKPGEVGVLVTAGGTNLSRSSAWSTCAHVKSTESGKKQRAGLFEAYRERHGCDAWVAIELQFDQRRVVVQRTKQVLRAGLVDEIAAEVEPDQPRIILQRARERKRGLVAESVLRIITHAHRCVNA